MASSSGPALNEKLQCSICLKVFTDPVTTPCGHNFCRTCLSRCWPNSPICFCPLCKEKFSRRPELKINTTLGKLVQHFKEKLKQESEVFCDICDEGKQKAVKTCLTCPSSYCETHLEPHLRVPRLKKHKLINPVENLEDYICQKHERPLELFCRDDQTCVCLFCTEGEHRTHNTVPIEEESREKKMIQDRMKKIQEITRSEQRKTRQASMDCPPTFSRTVYFSNWMIISLGVLLVAALMYTSRCQSDQLKMMEEEITELKRRNIELEQENTEQKRRNTELEQENTEQKRRNTDLEQENTELEQENTEQKRRNTELEQENTEQKRRNTELEQENTEQKRRNTELEQENTELKRRNTELEQENTEQKRRNTELEQENTELKRRNTELEQENTEQKRRNTELEQENTEQRRRNTDLEQENTEQKRRNTELEQENTEQKRRNTELEQENTEQRRRNTDLEQENTELTQTGLKFVQKFAVDVTLDPDTAYPSLILSDDGKQVSCGDIRQKVPENPKRFDVGLCVLAKQGFSSGRFYYEVQVKGKTWWRLGVARESINRKGGIPLKPEDGVWILLLMNENDYVVFDSPYVSLSLRVKPEKVGVFVDYEEGLVSFYDVESRSHIYSFTGQTFTDKLYPYFSPGFNDEGKNSNPLIITPVR